MGNECCTEGQKQNDNFSLSDRRKIAKVIEEGAEPRVKGRDKLNRRLDQSDYDQTINRLSQSLASRKFLFSPTNITLVEADGPGVLELPTRVLSQPHIWMLNCRNIVYKYYQPVGLEEEEGFYVVSDGKKALFFRNLALTQILDFPVELFEERFIGVTTIAETLLFQYEGFEIHVVCEKVDGEAGAGEGEEAYEFRVQDIYSCDGSFSYFEELPWQLLRRGRVSELVFCPEKGLAVVAMRKSSNLDSAASQPPVATKTLERRLGGYLNIARSVTGFKELIKLEGTKNFYALVHDGSVGISIFSLDLRTRKVTKKIDFCFKTQAEADGEEIGLDSQLRGIFSYSASRNSVPWLPEDRPTISRTEDGELPNDDENGATEDLVLVTQVSEVPDDFLTRAVEGLPAAHTPEIMMTDYYPKSDTLLLFCFGFIIRVNNALLGSKRDCERVIYLSKREKSNVVFNSKNQFKKTDERVYEFIYKVKGKSEQEEDRVVNLEVEFDETAKNIVLVKNLGSDGDFKEEIDIEQKYMSVRGSIPREDFKNLDIQYEDYSRVVNLVPEERRDNWLSLYINKSFGEVMRLSIPEGTPQHYPSYSFRFRFIYRQCRGDVVNIDWMKKEAEEGSGSGFVPIFRSIVDGEVRREVEIPLSELPCMISNVLEVPATIFWSNKDKIFIMRLRYNILILNANFGLEETIDIRDLVAINLSSVHTLDFVEETSSLIFKGERKYDYFYVHNEDTKRGDVVLQSFSLNVYEDEYDLRPEGVFVLEPDEEASGTKRGKRGGAEVKRIVDRKTGHYFVQYLSKLDSETIDQMNADSDEDDDEVEEEEEEEEEEIEEEEQVEEEEVVVEGIVEGIVDEAEGEVEDAARELEGLINGENAEGQAGDEEAEVEAEDAGQEAEEAQEQPEDGQEDVEVEIELKAEDNEDGEEEKEGEEEVQEEEGNDHLESENKSQVPQIDLEGLSSHGRNQQTPHKSKEPGQVAQITPDLTPAKQPEKKIKVRLGKEDENVVVVQMLNHKLTDLRRELHFANIPQGAELQLIHSFRGGVYLLVRVNEIAEKGAARGDCLGVYLINSVTGSNVCLRGFEQCAFINDRFMFSRTQGFIAFDVEEFLDDEETENYLG